MPLPNVILPGYFARQGEYQELETYLNEQGFPTVTVPLNKWQWIPTLGGRSVVPILRLIDHTVKETLDKYKASKVNLIAHSAGGWIARIYLGDTSYDIHGDVQGKEGIWQAHTYVSRLITLGSPHISEEKWTKKNLDFVNNNYPDAFYPHVDYICLAGKAIYGQKNWQGWLAYNSYKLTTGMGNCWGDGLIPVAAAHLEDAVNLTLDGVYHSPNSSGVWYGSPEIIPAWIDYLVP